MSAGLTLGVPCPEISLASGSGESVQLADQANQHPLVLTFYHLAFTGG